MSDELSIPIFLSREEIKHVNLAMKSYRKVIEMFPETPVTKRALELIDNVMFELQGRNDELVRQEASPTTEKE